MPCSCALLGGFAIRARVSLLRQHSAEREMSASACTRCMPGFNVDDNDAETVQLTPLRRTL